MRVCEFDTFMTRNVCGDLKHASEEVVVFDVPFRELVESMMWITNHTRPDIANAWRAIARFLLGPESIHDKVTRKILERLDALSDSGQTSRGVATWCLFHSSLTWIRTLTQITPMGKNSRETLAGRTGLGTQACVLLYF